MRTSEPARVNIKFACVEKEVVVVDSRDWKSTALEPHENQLSEEKSPCVYKEE